MSMVKPLYTKKSFYIEALIRRCRNDFFLFAIAEKVLCVTVVSICDIVELTGIVTSLEGQTTVATSAIYRFMRLGVRFIHGISASIHVVFCHFLNHFTFHIIEGLRMVACTFRRSEARLCPFIRPGTRLRLVQILRQRHSPVCLWSL